MAQADQSFSNYKVNWKGDRCMKCGQTAYLVLETRKMGFSQGTPLCDRHFLDACREDSSFENSDAAVAELTELVFA